MAEEAAGDGLEKKLAAVRLLAMDVDGVLTDGGILVNGDGTETKRFHVADGLGIQLMIHAGIPVAWISGRESAAVATRAEELGITHLSQGTRNKAVALAELMARYGLTPINIAYIGDDLNDLPAFSIAQVKFAPANAIESIKAHVDFVTSAAGGQGAVREVCDAILKAQSKWNEAVTRYLAVLLQQDPDPS
jgi:3-deoxy-D-manno-octulosonate 8-phosphate phosphatase (KDO 8-P phosphatase)